MLESVRLHLSLTREHKGHPSGALMVTPSHTSDFPDLLDK